MSRNKIISLISICLSVCLFLASIIVGVVNKATNDSLAIQSNEFALMGAGFVLSVVSFVVLLICKKNSLLALISVSGTAILGYYASLKVFDTTNNYTLLVVLLIVLLTVATIFAQLKEEYKWAPVTAAVAASILLIFYLFDSLAVMANYNNPFLMLVSLGILVLYVYVIAFNGLKICGDKEIEKKEKAPKEEVKEETVANEENTDVETPVEENNDEEVKEENAEVQSENNEEVKEDNSINAVNEDQEKKEESPYDNSSLINE